MCLLTELAGVVTHAALQTNSPAWGGQREARDRTLSGALTHTHTHPIYTSQQ